MVSNARDDFPDPDRPVMTTRESRGSSTVTSLRLCSRAPGTTIWFWRLDIRPPLSLRRWRTDFANGCSLRAGKAHGRGQKPCIQQLLLEVGEQRLDLQLLPRGPAEQLPRVVLAAVRVDIGTEPLADRTELARANVLVDIRDVVVERAPELGGHQVADRVRREVADHPRAPVDVLQDALLDRRHLEPHEAVR